MKAIRNICVLFIIRRFSILMIASTLTIFSTLKAQTVKTIIIDAGHGLPDPGNQNSYSREADITLAIAQKLYRKMQDSLPQIKTLMTRTNQNLPGGNTNKDVANRWRAEFANQNKGDLFVCIHANDASRVPHSEVTGHRKEVYYTGKKKKRKRHVNIVPIYRHWTTPSPAIGPETYIWASSENSSKLEFVKNNSKVDSTESTDESVDSTENKNAFNSPEELIMASLRTKKYFDRSLLLADLVQDEFGKQGRPIGRGVKQRNEKRIWVLQATAMPSILVETGFMSSPTEGQYLVSEEGQEQIASAIFNAIVRYLNQLKAGKVFQSAGGMH